jgi:hypothetical protein
MCASTISPDTTTAEGCVELKRNEEISRIACNRTALKIAMSADRTNALPILVYRNSTFVFIPQGRCVDDPFRRNPHGTGSVAYMSCVSPKRIRYPVSRVLRLTFWRNRSDQHCGKECGKDSFRDHE